MLGPGPQMLLLCVQVSLIGVLKALSGAFMSGEVIFFSVVLGTGTMGVGSEVMVLRRDLLRFVHDHYCARVAPSVAPGQTKALPLGLVRKLSPEVQDLLAACKVSPADRRRRARPRFIRPSQSFILAGWSTSTRARIGRRRPAQAAAPIEAIRPRLVIGFGVPEMSVEPVN